MENHEKQEQAKELTIRQHKFVRGYLEGKPMVRAATEAGYAPSTAARGAAELMRSPKVRSAIHEALEEAGVTGESLADVLREGLDATKVISYIEDGSPTCVEVEDWAVRYRFLELACKLMGAFHDNESAMGELTYETRLRQIIEVSQAAG